jgi:DNA repair protein RadD
MPLELRYYQGEAVQAIWDYFEAGNTGNPLVALATGTGKSLVHADLIQGMIERYPQTNILALTHVKKLITNNHATFVRQAPHLAALCGIFSAGVGRKDLGAQVTFAGIQSIAKRAALYHRTNIITVDEAHLIGDSGTSQYRTFLNAVRTYNPQVKVIGLTATPYRVGMGLLTDGDLFDEVVYNITEGAGFMRLVDEGYLAPLVPKQMDVILDTENIKLTAGDYNAKGVEDAIEEQDVLRRAVQEAVQVAADRGHWMVFVNSIASVDKVVEMLREYGISAAGAHSAMPSAQADEAIEAFIRGDLHAIVSKDMLTTGVDAPLTDCIVMLRPSRSPGLWVQMLGRGTRPAPGKLNCLVLDFVGNTVSMGPINYPQKPKPRRKGGGVAPVRECPGCQTLVHLSVRVCPECGHEFPPPESKLRASAGKDELMLRMEPLPPQRTRVVQVVRMSSARQVKEGRADSVKVTYYGPDGYPYHTWVGVEHPHQFVRKLARDWWAGHRILEENIPASTDALLQQFEDNVRIPYHVKVVEEGKYWRVKEYDFLGSAFRLDLGFAGPVPPLPSMVFAEEEKPAARWDPGDDIPF